MPSPENGRTTCTQQEILTIIATGQPSTLPTLVETPPTAQEKLTRRPKSKLTKRDSEGASVAAAVSAVGLSVAAMAVTGAAALWTAEQTGLSQQLIEAISSQVNSHTLQLPANPFEYPEIAVVQPNEPKAAETAETAVKPPVESQIAFIFKASKNPNFAFAVRQPETQIRFEIKQLPLPVEQGLAEYAEQQGYPPEIAQKAMGAISLPNPEFYNAQGDGFDPELLKVLETFRDKEPQARALAEKYLSWISEAALINPEIAKRYALLASFYSDSELAPQAFEKYSQALTEVLAREAVEKQAQEAEVSAPAAVQPQPQAAPVPQQPPTNPLAESTLADPEPAVEPAQLQPQIFWPEIKFGVGWSPLAVAQFFEGMLNLAVLAERDQGLAVYAVVACYPLAPGFDVCLLAGQRDENQEVTFVVLPPGLVSAGSILTGRSLADLAVQGLHLLQ